MNNRPKEPKESCKILQEDPEIVGATEKSQD